MSVGCSHSRIMADLLGRIDGWWNDVRRTVIHGEIPGSWSFNLSGKLHRCFAPHRRTMPLTTPSFLSMGHPAPLSHFCRRLLRPSRPVIPIPVATRVSVAGSGTIGGQGSVREHAGLARCLAPPPACLSLIRIGKKSRCPGVHPV